MNLYEINNKIAGILDCGFYVDEETGEFIDNGVDVMLAELEYAEDEKIENIALFIKDLLKDVSDLKAEEKALADRRRRKEKKAVWLQNYLSGYLLAHDRKKFETPRCALSFRRSQRVEISDAAALDAYSVVQPDVYRYKEPEINKTFIKDLLKAGQDVPGAALIEVENMQIK